MATIVLIAAAAVLALFAGGGVAGFVIALAALILLGMPAFGQGP
jgi:hypothetical protein